MNLSNPKDAHYSRECPVCAPEGRDRNSTLQGYNDLYPRPYVSDDDTYKPGPMLDSWRGEDRHSPFPNRIGHESGQRDVASDIKATDSYAKIDHSGPAKYPAIFPLRNTQVGGNHYSSLAIQPGEYALANNLNYWQGNALKYLTRYKSKGGEQDLDKAIHCLQMLKESEYGRPRDMPKAHSKARS